MKQVNLVIDEKQVEVEEGKTLFQAAETVGVKIPTLCYDKRLFPFGACRLCSVEVDDGRKQRIVASCVYPVEEGLVVRTDTPRVRAIRKVILELLLATSSRGQVEELGLSYKAEADEYEQERSFCILCGLCVRYCSEVKGKNVLGFIRRGVERQVVIFPENARTHCPTCDGGCIKICPTGVITNRFAIPIPRFGSKYPTLFPVKMWDEYNIEDLSETVK